MNKSTWAWVLPGGVTILVGFFLWAVAWFWIQNQPETIVVPTVGHGEIVPLSAEEDKLSFECVTVYDTETFKNNKKLQDFCEALNVRWKHYYNIEKENRAKKLLEEMKGKL